MANIIAPRRSSVAAKVPTAAQLAYGEIAVNLPDQKLWVNNNGTVVQIGAGQVAGLSDVAITSPTSGQTLTFNGTQWVNTTNLAAGVGSFNSRSGAVTLTSSDVTTALGFTPDNAANASSYAQASALANYLPLAGGSMSGNILFNSATIAAAGTTQATATAVTADNTYVGSGTGGVILPAASSGREISITNNTAAAINVYPGTGASIENAAANSPVVLPAYATIGVAAKSSTNWWTTEPVFTASTGVSITQSANGTVTWTNTGVTSYNGRTGAITETSSDVVNALGFTPYNASNPSGFITSSALSSYLPLAGGTLSGTLNLTSGNSLAVPGNLGVYASANYFIRTGVPTSYQYAIFIPQSTQNVNIGTETDQGYKLFVNGTGYVNGTLTANGQINASSSGFTSSTYATGARNPIWRFGNADSYGLSYFQGTAGLIGSLDTIGIHMGTATAAGSQWTFNQSDSSFRSAGYLYRAGNLVLDAANYNNYSPTLTGGNASGTWGINVTGNAGTVSGFRNYGTITVQAVSGSSTSCTTAQFVSWYSSNYNFLAFGYTVAKCSWSYAGNNTISDTNLGTVETAGAVIETFSDGTYYTIRITLPTTGTGAGQELIYNNQGSGYSPGWRTPLNTNNYGSYALPLSGGTLSGPASFTGNNYTYYGPNTTWGAYLKVGGNGIDGSTAQIATTNGNLHLESLSSSYGIYLNYYRGGPVYIGNGASATYAVLHAGNYNSYSPTLTGGNASGTWGISITGNAGNISTTGVNYGSYGSIGVAGSTNNYVGISFSAQSTTWMSSTSSGVGFGVYQNNNSWVFYFDTSGTMQVGTIPASHVSGTVATATTAASCSGNAATVSSISSAQVTSALGYTPYYSANFASSIATNGYQKFPSGLIIQWGVVVSQSSGGITTVTLPIAFPNANLGAHCNDTAPSNGNTNTRVQTISTTQLTIYNGEGTAGNNYWMALGY